MATYTYTSSFSVAGVGINGATVNAYKASRFSSEPALNAAAPGSADATTTTGTAAGYNGAFQIALPTFEDYYISVTYLANTYWQGPVSQVFADGTAQGGTAAAGTVGTTGDVLIAGGVATLQDTASVEGTARAAVTQAARRHGSAAWDNVPIGTTAVTTVAANSGGVNVNTFTGAGVLNVAPVPVGAFADQVTHVTSAPLMLTVNTSGVNVQILYTGCTIVSGNVTAFTGCTTLPSGSPPSLTLATGGTVYGPPQAVADVVVCADSILYGQGANLVNQNAAGATTDWFSAILARENRAAGLPDPGRGWRRAANPLGGSDAWSALAGGANSVGSVGPSTNAANVNCYTVNGNGNIAADTFAFRRAVVHIQGVVGGDNFQVNFGGGYGSTVVNNAAGLITVDSGDLGNVQQRTVSVKQVTAGGTGVIVCGYLAYQTDGTTGVVGYNFATSATTTANWITPTGWDTIWLPYIQPRRIYMMLGLNDLNTSVSLSTVTANLTTLITRAQKGSPLSEIVLCSPWHVGSGTFNTTITNANWYSQFVAAVNLVAFQTGCTFVDASSWMGDAAIWAVANCTTTAAGTSATVTSGGFPNIENGMYVTDAGLTLPAIAQGGGVKVSSVVGNTVNFSGNTAAITASTNTLTATATNGTTTLTFSVANAALVTVNQTVTGAGITSNGLVTAVNYVTGVVTISGTITTLTVSAYVFAGVTLNFTNDILGISAQDGVHFGDSVRSTSGLDAQQALAEMFWLNLSYYKPPPPIAPGPGWLIDFGGYPLSKTLPLGRVWTRTANTTFTMNYPTTLVGIYAKGTKLRWAEAGVVKYGVVASSSFSASTLLTTVTMISTADYVMAASPDIGSNWISYGSPPLFPTEFTWAHATSGITASGVFAATWSVNSGICTLTYVTAVAPTSNATTFGATAPILSAASGQNLGYGTDNGSSATVTAAVIRLPGASTAIVFDKNVQGGAWTNGSTKSVNFGLVYPI